MFDLSKKFALPDTFLLNRKTTVLETVCIFFLISVMEFLLVNYGQNLDDVVFEQPHNLMSSKIRVMHEPFVRSKMISPHYVSIEWQSEYTPKKKKQPSLK